MKKINFVILCAILCDLSLSTPVTEINSLVISSTESPKESEESSLDNNNGSPKIYSMEIKTNITNRFATTLVVSKVKNPQKIAAETTFSVVLPTNAFISEFVMEIGGISYKAYVKEKQEAKKIYDAAVSSGQSAAHVEVNARDSSTFTVSVNIEPQSKTTFKLKYEELLQRQYGRYELVLNIHPGQIIKDLNVEVHINETRPLKFVETPSIRTGNEISKNDDKLKPSAEISTITPTSATVTFHPDAEKQKELAGYLGTQKENGLAGQFVVQYDVERDPYGGEVLVRDGYFVHFFSPSDLESLPKQVVFVLDNSGSMGGRKIEQLNEAMNNILSDLKPDDVFNIVRFSDSASVWDTEKSSFFEVTLDSYKYGELEPILREKHLPSAVEVSPENIDKAKQIIKTPGYMSSTNIIAGLEVGLFLIKKTQETSQKKFQPMIVFLTDGQPNEGISETNEIIRVVTKLNSRENPTSIFSLSFGDWADKKFLQKLSAQNFGFSRHIYEAADASLQLQEFYRQISSPLLNNITFSYVNETSQVTKTHYPLLFGGSELVVAGRINNPHLVPIAVRGIARTGLKEFVGRVEQPVTSLERLWAYLTVKQILEARETANNKTELTQKALDISLKYSFVTKVSSLVVVKPNNTDSVDPQKSSSRGGDRHHLALVPISQHSSQVDLRVSALSGYSSHTRPSIHGGYPVYRYHAPASPSYPVSHFVPPPPRFYPPAGIVSGSMPLNSVVPTSSVVSRLPIPNTPTWLESLRNGNGTITTTQGTFQLGKAGDISIHPECARTPLNGTGECTIIFDCPSIYSYLTDKNTYLQYFCPLNLYAGICCPKKVGSTLLLP